MTMLVLKSWHHLRLDHPTSAQLDAGNYPLGRSLRAIADELAARGIRTPHKGTWLAATVALLAMCPARAVRG